MTNKLAGFGSTEEIHGTLVHRRLVYDENTELWTCYGYIESTKVGFSSRERQVAIDRLQDYLMRMQWGDIEPGVL
jgi:hypothetical protein